MNATTLTITDWRAIGNGCFRIFGEKWWLDIQVYAADVPVSFCRTGGNAQFADADLTPAFDEWWATL